MRRLRIVPAAAGIIALTATVCFAQDQREFEERDDGRTKVVVHVAEEKTQSVPLAFLPEAGSAADKEVPLYLVEVEHRNRLREVVVDAQTGRVLGKRDVKPDAT